jgi:hypothetical protein
MVKPAALRSKSVGTKVTEEEYSRLEALAGGQSMSEWVRDVLLRAGEREAVWPADETLLSEVMVLRTILVNTIYKLVRGEPIEEDSFRQLIAVADAKKRATAQERLANPAGEPPQER